MATAEELLAIAKKELGTKELPANSNKVKYNTWYYGSEVSGSAYPWCMVFVQWVFNQANVKLPIKTASCGALMRAAQKSGSWVTAPYRAGDVVIYDFDGDGGTDHCGIVESVLSGGIMAIEGNTDQGNDANGGQVQLRARSNKLILGAFRPTYSEEVRVMDNTPSAAYKEGVEWATKNGIMKGNTDGDLMLSQPVTREQMCTFLKRMYDLLKG